MPLTETDIVHTAVQARLRLDQGEIAHYTQQITTILGYIAQLETVDTHDIEPLANPLDLNQRLRPDHITESNQRERLQAIAPQVDHGLYLVPKVIDS